MCLYCTYINLIERLGGPGASRTKISNILPIALHSKFPVPPTEKVLELSGWKGRFSWYYWRNSRESPFIIPNVPILVDRMTKDSQWGFIVHLPCHSFLQDFTNGLIVFLQGFAIGLIVSIKRDNSKQEYPYLYRYIPKNDLRYCYLFSCHMYRIRIFFLVY